MDEELQGDPSAVMALVEGRIGDPFALLGPRRSIAAARRWRRFRRCSRRACSPA